MDISRMDVSSITQVALLGTVTANLNAITVNISNEKLDFSFFYETKPTEKEIELGHTFLKKIALYFNDIKIENQKIEYSMLKKIPLQSGDQLLYQKSEERYYLFKIKTFYKKITISSLRSVTQFALLGNVTENLRGVSVSFEKNNLTFHCYFNEKKTYWDDSCAWAIRRQTIYSFLDAEGELEQYVIPEPEKIPLKENSFWIYLRHENEVTEEVK